MEEGLLNYTLIVASTLDSRGFAPKLCVDYRYLPTFVKDKKKLDGVLYYNTLRAIFSMYGENYNNLIKAKIIRFGYKKISKG